MKRLHFGSGSDNVDWGSENKNGGTGDDQLNYAAVGRQPGLPRDRGMDRSCLEALETTEVGRAAANSPGRIPETIHAF